MRKSPRTLQILVLFTSLLATWSTTLAQQGSADPSLAMTRIKSHGASATVIATTDGRSWLLGCAHMIMNDQGGVDPQALSRALKLDGPAQPRARNQGTASARIIAYDLKLDLSLIEIDNGPFNFVPVAKKGFRPGKNIQSLGYDDMKWPVTTRSATILQSTGDTTYTAEKPWHGRSGGALVDLDAGVLIGVVQGYEVYPNSRGLYVSHDAIVRFLEKNWPRNKQVPPGQQYSMPRMERHQPFLQAFPGGC